MNKKLVSEKLKKMRLDAKESQAELARKLGVSAMAISKYESGEMIPSDEVKVRIARHYNVSVDSIFFSEM